MFSSVRRTLGLPTFLAMILAIGLPASAHQLLPGQQAPSGTASANGVPADPLGRNTPSGTLYGFLQAAQSGNYSLAAQYLQMSAAKRQSQGEEVASKLKVVIDRSFSGDLRRLSNQPEGTPQPGLPLDKQRVGSLNSGDVEADLILVRVSDVDGGRIWLISSETLAKVPELYEQAAVHQVETHLPQTLVRNELWGLPAWQWLATLLAIPVAAVLAWLIVQFLRLPWYLWARYRKHAVANGWNVLERPLWLMVGIVVHGILVGYFRLPVLPRHRYQQVIGVLAVIGACWLLWRILREVMRTVRRRAVLAGRMGTGSLMILGERILKVVIVILAIFVILGTLGVNLTTPLAGLGIGGIAVALAAQKTLENLLGGVSLLSDEVIRVGDVCRFGDRTGTVEDISLRSTRVRTQERSELYIPNGALSTVNVENLSRRDKILFNANLGLRYETSSDQLRYVLAEVRRLLYEHPKVETDGARIRLIGFDSSTITLEVFCYVLTRDTNEFLAIREDLLLRIMDTVYAAGTAFGLPPTILNASRDPALDKEKAAKAEQAEQAVKKWREANRLPFPDHAPAEISEFSNSLPYPPPGSALGKKRDAQ